MSGRPAVCFVGLDNYAFLRPDLAIKHMGGEAVQQSLLARQFAACGHRVTTISLDYGGPETERIDGIQIIKAYKPGAGIRGIRFFYPRMWKVWAALKEADAEIYFQSPAGVLTGITAAFCRVYRRFFVFRIASDANCVPGQQLIRFWRDRKLFEYGMRTADLRCVQTDRQRSLLMDNYGLESVVVNMVAEPIDDDREVDRDIDVLWVNNLRDVKRPDRVIEIARQLPHYKFVMIGGASRGCQGLYNEIEEEASKLANLDFLGTRSYADVNAYLLRAKLLLNTSELEGFPNTFLQAWMRGVPVITTFDPDGLVGAEGLGASTIDSRELVPILRRFLEDTEMIRSCSESVKSFVVQGFAPGAVVRKYLKLFKESVQCEWDH